MITGPGVPRAADLVFLGTTSLKGGGRASMTAFGLIGRTSEPDAQLGQTRRLLLVALRS